MYSSVLAYTGVIEQTDGTTVVWNRRERPHVYQNPNTGQIDMLSTGVGNAVDGWTIGQDWTWTRTHFQVKGRVNGAGRERPERPTFPTHTNHHPFSQPACFDPKRRVFPPPDAALQQCKVG